MNTRTLTSSIFYDILIDACFDNEEFWYFGVYDRDNHVVFLRQIAIIYDEKN